MTFKRNCALIFSSHKVKINKDDFDFIFTDNNNLDGNNVIILKSLISKNSLNLSLKKSLNSFYASNDIEKFILISTSEILDLIDRYKITNLTIYGGTDKLYFPIIFGDHIEDRRKAFISKPYIINPIIFKLLKDKIDVRWLGRKLNIIFYFNFLLRCIFLFFGSVYEVITKPSRFYEKDGKVIIFRSKFQQNFIKNNLKVSSKPKGKKLFFKAFAALLKSFTKHKETKCYLEYNNTAYKVDLKWTEIENSLLLDSFYRIELIKALQNKNEIITLETSSRFSIIDRENFQNKLKLLLTTDIQSVKFRNQVNFDGFLIKKNDLKNEQYIKNNFVSNDFEYFHLERESEVEYDYFFASQPYGQEILESFINSFLNLESNKIIFRKHPRDKYSYNFKRKILIDSDNDPLNTISKSKIIIGLTSTILADGLIMGKIAVSLNIDERTRYHNNMHPNKKIFKVEKPSELLEIYNALKAVNKNNS